MRFRKAKGGDGGPHSRGGIVQHIKMLYRARIVADLELDTIACKYPHVTLVR